MKVNKAIIILEDYQAYRRGNSDVLMHTTAEISESIAIVLKTVKNG